MYAEQKLERFVSDAKTRRTPRGHKAHGETPDARSPKHLRDLVTNTVIGQRKRSLLLPSGNLVYDLVCCSILMGVWCNGSILKASHYPCSRDTGSSPVTSTYFGPLSHLGYVHPRSQLCAL